MSSSNPKWESNSPHDILVACVGYNFGPEPETKLPQIRAARGGYGRAIAHRMGLNKADTVLDLGSGCGFVGRTIAPLVKQLYCADISKDFLAFCAGELAEFDNVKTFQIEYADFTGVPEVNKVYSSAVWIHFTFYDMVHYLLALKQILPVTGIVYFDYADPEGLGLDPTDDKSFANHLEEWKKDRADFYGKLHFNSLAAVKVALRRAGYRFMSQYHIHGTSYSVMATRVK